MAGEYVLNRVEHEEQGIRGYFEWQAPDEHIEHLEKLHSEAVLGRRIDVWDVHTDQGRWWVLTSPTNLYSQKHFPSMDYLLSFHIGLSARMMAQEERAVAPAWSESAGAAWRVWTRAAEEADGAEDVEDFQAVGARCREALLAFIRAVADEAMVPASEDPPKLADFQHWTEYIANAIAPGERLQEVRGHLKSTARSTWQLVSWLTHAKNAVRLDATLAVDAAQHTLASFTSVLLRHEGKMPDRCPRCESSRLVSEEHPEVNEAMTLCTVCGWNDADVRVAVPAPWVRAIPEPGLAS